MSKLNDGGPAFPVPLALRLSDGQPMTAAEYFEGGNGMTLRDWFAGQALLGLCSSEDHPWLAGRESRECAALDAYSVADAMIAARAANGKESA